jgi:hypothetical protein
MRISQAGCRPPRQAPQAREDAAFVGVDPGNPDTEPNVF